MAAMRFSSMPAPASLLSELQAHRAMDSSEGGPELWQQRLNGQVLDLCLSWTSSPGMLNKTCNSVINRMVAMQVWRSFTCRSSA